MDIKDESNRLYGLFLMLDNEYEKYAKSIGMNYTSLSIFHLIYIAKQCTQKDLCDKTLFLKQTVNSIVMSLKKQGLLEMIELPEDRRHKAICLTDKGKEFAEKVLPPVNKAEIDSLKQFSEGERKCLFSLLEKYTYSFQKNIREQISST